MKDINIYADRIPRERGMTKRWWALMAILTTAILAVILTVAAAYAGERTISSSSLEQAKVEYDELDTAADINNKIEITPTTITIRNALDVTATYQVRLLLEPTSTVTVSIKPDESLSSWISLDPQELYFKTTSWDKTQTVTLEITQTLTSMVKTPVIRHSSTSEDPNFDFGIVELPEVTVEVDFLIFLPLIVPEELSGPSEWEQVGDLDLEIRSVLACAEEKEIYAGTKENGLYRKLWKDAWVREFKQKIDGPVWAIARKNAGSCDSLYVAEYSDTVWYLHGGDAYEVGDDRFDKLTSLVVRGDEIFVGDINGIYRARIPAAPTDTDPYDWQLTAVRKLVMSLTLQPGENCIYAAIWDDGARANCTPGNWELWTDSSAPAGDPYALEVIGLDGPPQPEYLRMGSYYGLYDWQAGSDWGQANAPRKLTWALATQKTQDGRINFAGQANGGVLKQIDDAPWSQYGASPEMAQKTVRDLMIEGNTLYAATEKGVWHILISD